MLFIPLTIDVTWLCGVIAVSLITGFMFRSGQLKKAKKKVAELEKEMVLNHAEILELQKDKIVLQEQLKGSSIPVIPILSREEKKADNKSAGKK